MHSCRVLSIVWIVAAGCSADESSQVPTGSHEAGLEIIGSARADNYQVVDVPLDIELLTQDLTSACLDEVNDAFPQLCGEDSQGLVIVQGCPGHQCWLALESCVGEMYMQIADEVSEFHLEANSRQVDDSGMEWQVTGDVEYTIPPQSAANRTLAYRLATEAFAEAGEHGVAAIRSEQCMTEMMRTADEPDAGQNRAVVFSVGYGQVIQAFMEATEKLASNRVRVAAETAEATRDFGDASGVLWNAEENSIRAALAGLAHADDPDDMNLELEACSSPLDAAGVQNALSLLRQAAVRGIVEEVGDDVVVEQVRDALAQDLPDLYSAGEDPEVFLDRFDLTMADVVQARNYLKDEHRVFGRTMEEIVPGSGRIAGLMRPPAPKPDVTALAGTAGARALPTANVVAASYRYSGAMQMLDYMRWGGPQGSPSE